MRTVSFIDFDFIVLSCLSDYQFNKSWSVVVLVLLAYYLLLTQ